MRGLQFENGQLRTELKAQQAANMKLRREKDEILLALRECKEENRCSDIPSHPGQWAVVGILFPGKL